MSLEAAKLAIVAAVWRRHQLQLCLPRRSSDCHGQGLTSGHDFTFRTIGPSVEVPRRLCVHNVCQHDESRRRQVRLSRQASAPALTLSHAASSMPGQCGSSSAKRCEHVEVTLSGGEWFGMDSLVSALTRKSWLRPQNLWRTNFEQRSYSRPLATRRRLRGLR